jgi:hypothetical protein
VGRRLHNASLSGLLGCQPLDICFSLQMVAEIGLDYHSTWGIAQADIKQYYDAIAPLQAVHAFCDVGADWDDARACLRLHMMPRIVLQLMNAACPMERRVIGVMTGSRAASLIAILPVWDAICCCRGCCHTCLQMMTPTPPSKGRLFDRAVASLVLYRAPRWSWTQVAEDLLNRQQMRMMCVLCKIKFRTEETWKHFSRRRMECSFLLGINMWGKAWAKKAAS